MTTSFGKTEADRRDPTETHLPIPFAEGQVLGSQGLPIPPTVVDNYLTYLNLMKNSHSMSPEDHAAFIKAAARSASRSKAERGIAQTDMERALDAQMLVEGYVSSDGLVAFLTKPNGDGVPIMSMDAMIRRHPGLVPTSEEGIVTYMQAYNLRKPSYLDQDGEINLEQDPIANVAALGVIVRAAEEGVLISPDEVPVSESDWKAFNSGMSGNVFDLEFDGQLITADQMHSSMSNRLIQMHALGLELFDALAASMLN
jgi:hypothetical protein